MGLFWSLISLGKLELAKDRLSRVMEEVKSGLWGCVLGPSSQGLGFPVDLMGMDADE